MREFKKLEVEFGRRQKGGLRALREKLEEVEGRNREMRGEKAVIERWVIGRGKKEGEEGKGEGKYLAEQLEGPMEGSESQ